MIDSDGFRPNVGIILTNDVGQVLWARRINQDAWQFPQGGINDRESPEEALYRELNEEVGLEEQGGREHGHGAGQEGGQGANADITSDQR